MYHIVSNLVEQEISLLVTAIQPKQKLNLGGKPQYGIEEMVRDSWNWQRNNPNGY